MKNYDFKFSNIIYLTILHNHENRNLAFKTIVVNIESNNKMELSSHGINRDYIYFIVIF